MVGISYDMGIAIYLLVLDGVLILVIALETVSYQAITAATAHPVDALRSE
jgi:hypothetical protein